MTFVVRGQKFVVRGQKFVVRGQKFVVRGQKFVVRGQKFVVRGPGRIRGSRPGRPGFVVRGLAGNSGRDSWFEAWPGFSASGSSNHEILASNREALASNCVSRPKIRNGSSLIGAYW